jgi:hypothetical protein
MMMMMMMATAAAAAGLAGGNIAWPGTSLAVDVATSRRTSITRRRFSLAKEKAPAGQSLRRRISGPVLPHSITSSARVAHPDPVEAGSSDGDLHGFQALCEAERLQHANEHDVAQKIREAAERIPQP